VAIRTFRLDWNTVHPGETIVRRAVMTFTANALCRAVPADMATISPSMNSCLVSLSRSMARYSSNEALIAT
jgi:hypothetical protein